MTWPRSLYEDRADAGSVLAEHVRGVLGDSNAVVLALPRGGVPVAAPVAEVLSAPLDLLAVPEKPNGRSRTWRGAFAPTVRRCC
jgi:predicted phosphoribosyltransferase